jgi:hypothetical protein
LKHKMYFFLDWPPFSGVDVFTLMSLYIIVIVCRVIHADIFVKVQTFEPQLSDSDTSTGNQTEKFSKTSTLK